MLICLYVCVYTYIYIYIYIFLFLCELKSWELTVPCGSRGLQFGSQGSKHRPFEHRHIKCDVLLICRWFAALKAYPPEASSYQEECFCLFSDNCMFPEVEIPQAEHVLHIWSDAPLYPHFNVGYALTHHLQHVSSSPLRLLKPRSQHLEGDTRGMQYWFDAEYFPPTVADVVLRAPYTGPSSCTSGLRRQHCTLHFMQNTFRLRYISIYTMLYNIVIL